MEMNNDIDTLKERLSPFIAFKCTFTDLDEYWVPVHLSSMQTEQYCSILASNSGKLSASSRKSPLRDILTQIQKCCDHPFLADPTLRNSSKEGSLIDDDPLAAEINVSGKFQVLDKLLLEIKRCGLRALVLFHSAVNAEKISTGHFLDDLVHRRFGENAYIHIPVITVNYAPAKKKESLEKFNNAESECFICLCDYRACHSSIRLSRLDAVVLFNSDCNPSTDIRALKRMTVDPHRDRLHVFRFYSAFTVEEKALILSNQGTPVDCYFRWRACHRLLGWGASYLFSKLQSCTDTKHQSFIDDLVHEMSSLLRNMGAKPGPTKRSIISRVVTPVESILLYGETENLTNESLSIDDYLIDNRHSVFWNKLVKESQLGRVQLCDRLSRRVPKSNRNMIEDANATSPSFLRSMPRSRRKLVKNVGRKWTRTHTPFATHQPCETATPSTALNPGTNEGQQSQTDQPRPHTLETEIERIQKEREKIAKSH
ncbi:helicase protein MOM1-like [Bidens hawaiensis]|uniref:helicase protein MOM1-like n=2 Tax=Bidens hawaiensis TaxID=980011 RepID=UPI00404AA54D